MSDFSQPPPVNPYDSPEMARPGMSSAAKVLLGLGIGCGVLVLLCCGGFIFTGVYFTRSIQQAMSEEPDTIRRVADSIVAIDACWTLWWVRASGESVRWSVGMPKTYFGMT